MFGNQMVRAYLVKPKEITMLRFTALTLALSTLANAGSAQPYKAVNRLQVHPISATEFEVVENYGEGARGMFCAAGEFAQRRLGMRSGRIYIVGPRGPSKFVQGRKGAVFSIAQNAAEPINSLTATVRHVGYNVSVGTTRQWCRDAIEEKWEWETDRF